MSAESALKTWLSTDGDLAALVGERIFPVKIPQGTSLPCVTYQKTGRPRVSSLLGPSGLAGPQFQVHIWALTFTEVQAIADAIRGTKSNPKLDGFRGWVGNVHGTQTLTQVGNSVSLSPASVAGDTFIQAATVPNQIDLYQDPQHGDDQGVHHSILEVNLWVEE